MEIDDYGRILKEKTMRVYVAALIFLLSLQTFAQNIVVEPNGENSDAYREISGSWLDSVAISSVPEHTTGVKSRFTEKVANSEFTPKAMVVPPITENATYEVLVSWPSSGNLKNITYTITHANGKTDVLVDQDGWGASGTSNANKWISLGKFTMTANSGHGVLIDGSSAISPVKAGDSARLYATIFMFRKIGTAGPVSVNPSPVAQPSVAPSGPVYQPSQPSTVYQPSVPPVSGSDSALWASSFSDAQSKAKSGNRKILLFFFSEMVPGCKNYESYFASSAFQSVLAKYAPLKIDISKDRTLASSYKVYRVPTIIVTDQNGSEILRLKSELSQQELLNQLQ